jgi:hypothetical protein
MSELLVGIRVIKYFNWQGFFTDRINMKRDEELKYLAGIYTPTYGTSSSTLLQILATRVQVTT